MKGLRRVFIYPPEFNCLKDMRSHSGQICTVIDLVHSKHIRLEERIWRVRFDDGYENYAFEDELK